jgi:hypothetical protein
MSQSWFFSGCEAVKAIFGPSGENAMAATATLSP